jgi:hypothetical protein
MLVANRVLAFPPMAAGPHIPKSVGGIVWTFPSHPQHEQWRETVARERQAYFIGWRTS